MGVNSNQYLQGINQTTGTGAPVHSAVAGDRYTDTANGTTYQYTTSWQTVSYSAGSSGGIWGISNSSGVYTYYATWALAVAAATSGQCIELFADITETTVSYILKNGVNVNGNGHTITFSNSLNGFDDNNIACTVVFSDINLVKTQNLAYAIIQCFNASSNVGGYNTVINVANASGYGFFGSGTIWGFTVIGQSYLILVRYATTLVVDNCKVYGTGGVNLNDTCTFSNCYMKSSGAVNSGNLYNSTIICTAGVTYFAINGNTKVTNTILISFTSNVVQAGTVSGVVVFDNCYIYSAGERPINSSNVTEYHNCYIESATAYINQYGVNCGSFYNCTLKTQIERVFYGPSSPKIYNSNIICNWNNAAGRITDSCVNVVMINNYMSVANSSAFVNYSASASNIYMYGNAIKGTSNINSAVITNLQTNTADAQGNVILQ